MSMLPVSKSGVKVGASSIEEQFQRSPWCAARQAARARRAAAATCGMAAGWRRHARACPAHSAPPARAAQHSRSVQLPSLSCRALQQHIQLMNITYTCNGNKEIPYCYCTILTLNIFK